MFTLEGVRALPRVGALRHGNVLPLLIDVLKEQRVEALIAGESQPLIVVQLVVQGQQEGQMFGFEQLYFPVGERDAATADEALRAWTTVTIDVPVRLVKEIVVAQGTDVDLG